MSSAASVFLASAPRIKAMVRVLKHIFRYVKYAFVLFLVSLCYVAFLKSSIKAIEIDVEKKFETVPAKSPEMQPTRQALTSIDHTIAAENSIEPKYTRVPVGHLAPVGVPSTDPNRTLDWLDLWANDTLCNKFSVHLLEDNSVEPRTLVSFPGSGNTWLRMLLMGLTGVYIDTVYHGDEQFPTKAGTIYELRRDCNCTLLQKTHDFSLFSILYNAALNNTTEELIYHELKKFDGNGILLIRNPFKAILSYRNFAFGGNMAGMAPPEAFSQSLDPPIIDNRPRSTWDLFIARSIASWEKLAIVWIRGLKKGGVVFYEKLRRETGAELVNLAKMLGISEVSQERLDCVLQHNQDNTFKRKESGHNYPKNPFTDSQRLLILKSIEAVQEALKERGLGSLPIELYDYYTPLFEYGSYV